jgi:hypothetical protein
MDQSDVNLAKVINGFVLAIFFAMLILVYVLFFSI